MKFVANLLVAIHIVAAAEAILLGFRSGLNPETAVKAIGDGAGSSSMFQVRGPLMVKRAWDEPNVKNSVFQKDMKLIGEALQEAGCPVPLFSACIPIYIAANASGSSSGSRHSGITAVIIRESLSLRTSSIAFRCSDRNEHVRCLRKTCIASNPVILPETELCWRYRKIYSARSVFGMCRKRTGHGFDTVNHAENPAFPVPRAPFSGPRHRALCPLVLTILPYLARLGRADDRTWSERGSFHHWTLGAAVCTGIDQAGSARDPSTRRCSSPP
jgi:hypothetical protein